MNEVALRKCRRQLSWHADSGQLHVTTEPGGGRAALRLRTTSHAFLLCNMVCAAGQRFRPGRAAFKANGPGRALGQTNDFLLFWPMKKASPEQKVSTQYHFGYL